MASQIQRAERMIVGSLLSDAATMGLHWIYNQNDIAEKVLTRGGSPAFFNPPACPFYTYEAGSLSPYGDEIVPFLRSMATEGEFVPQSAATASYEFFKTYTGRLNHPSKHFVESWDAGKGWEDCACVDHQAQGIIKTPLLVARYAGSAELDLKIKSAVDVLQVSELSISASKLSAKILERILLTGDAPSDAIAWLGEQVDSLEVEQGQILRFLLNDSLLSEWTHFVAMMSQQPVNDEDKWQKGRIQGKILPLLVKSGDLAGSIDTEEIQGKDRDFVLAAKEQAKSCEAREYGFLDTMNAFGLSCMLPNAILGALYVARTSSTYEEAVTKNILAGGDNCSRGIVIGGLFAASNGPGGELPEGWLSNLKPTVREEITALAAKVASTNAALE